MPRKSPGFLLWQFGAVGRSERVGWRPAIDVYRCDQGWLVKVDLAGVCREDIQLNACGNALTLRGKRRDLSVQQGHRSYSMEIAYNRFERVIELPIDIEAARMSTEYQDGMLLIHLVTENQEQ